MDSVFSVTERPSERLARAALIETCRSRWELEKRVSALESELGERAAAERELRDKLAKMNYQQRDLLNGLARIVDDCDDILQVERVRIGGARAEDASVLHSKKWYRRIERIRVNLIDRLDCCGVTVHIPAGMPSPDLDRIHSTIETDAVPPGEIVRVLRTGLLWNGSVLRGSLVIVAAPRDPNDEDSQAAARAPAVREVCKAPPDIQHPTPELSR